MPFGIVCVGMSSVVIIIFGGIWIRNKEEYAKFASAVETYGIEEDGEGVTFTDNFFYAYYWNIDGKPIPFASVYMNKDESQDVVDYVNKQIGYDGRPEGVRRYINRAIERVGRKQTQNNDSNGSNNSLQNRGEYGGLGRNLLRKGRYFDRPDLYVKTERFGRGDRQGTGVMFRVANENQEIFVSNAARAVEGIKQEKATPQQWLAI